MMFYHPKFNDYIDEIYPEELDTINAQKILNIASCRLWGNVQIEPNLT